MRLRSFHRARPYLVLASIALAVVMSGCGDKRIRSLATGINRDSAMKLLGATAADTTPYIFHHAQYIVNGRDVEVLYYDARGRKRFRDTVPGGDLTPVVLENGKVTGTGWPHWEQVAKAANIVPLRRDARN